MMLFFLVDDLVDCGTVKMEDGFNDPDNDGHDDIDCDGDGDVDDVDEGDVNGGDGDVDDEGDREELVGSRGRRRLHLLSHVRSLLWTLYIQGFTFSPLSTKMVWN